MRKGTRDMGSRSQAHWQTSISMLGMWRSLMTASAKTLRAHPMQPIVWDKHRVLRFKENRIVSALLNFASNRGMSLNEIACMKFSREDREQLAQLIGYSVS